MARYAILSDIHSNLEALNTVLEKCRQEGLTEYICLGDVVGYNANPNECIDLVKKHLFQGHNLDKQAIAKELGDIAWYLAETATALDIPLETIFETNIEKLKKRYPDGFNARRSVNRTD